MGVLKSAHTLLGHLYGFEPEAVHAHLFGPLLARQERINLPQQWTNASFGWPEIVLRNCVLESAIFAAQIDVHFFYRLAFCHPAQQQRGKLGQHRS